LIRESENASSKKDFIYKLNVALKEADETLYWLELLNRSGFLENKIFNSMENDCKELIKLLVSSLKTAKQVV
jgi:four helix bundle protein